MAIEFRDVTQLEAITQLEDGAYILVIVDGVAKMISKANANFGGGGGTTTTFKVDVNIETDPFTYTLKHTDGSDATAQELYDAFVAGIVYIGQDSTISIVGGIIRYGTADNVTGVKYYATPDTTGVMIGSES